MEMLRKSPNDAFLFSDYDNLEHGASNEAHFKLQ